VALAERGTLKKYNVELIGATLEAIRKAEDRKLFKKTMQDVACACPRAVTPGRSRKGGDRAQHRFSDYHPAVFYSGRHRVGNRLRQDELLAALRHGLETSPVGEVLMENRS